MIQRISGRLADKCHEHGIIGGEDKDIYVFGFATIIKYALNLIIPLLIALWLSILPEMAVFIISYWNLRRYAGGYHAKSDWGCFIVSHLVIVAFSFIILFAGLLPFWFLCSVLVASIGIIFGLSPVEAVNNPLNESERRVYRKKSLIISIVYVGLFFATIFFARTSAISLICSLLSMAIHLIVGRRKGKVCTPNQFSNHDILD